MPRSLTAEEADQVAQQARGDGDRPDLFIASRNSEEQISVDFEAWLIITDSSLRTQIANFFQTLLDNDPNDLETRTELLLEFLQEEIRNAQQFKEDFESITELYDTNRESLSGATDGFTDIAEVTLLQEALNNSFGPIVEQTDRFNFDYAALTVLQTRANGENASNFQQELESWIRVLAEYE